MYSDELKAKDALIALGYALRGLALDGDLERDLGPVSRWAASVMKSIRRAEVRGVKDPSIEKSA